MPKLESPIPAYIPFDTFTKLLKHLKEVGVPSRIDKSVLPNMPALTRGQIISTLRFLRLIDDSSLTSSGALQELADAYETDGWSTALKEHVLVAYDDILGGLDLKGATPHQLNEKFDKVVGAEQMRIKSERFFLTALTEAKADFSPHLVRPKKAVARSKPRTGQRRTPAKSKSTDGNGVDSANPPASNLSGSQKQDQTPAGMIDIPVPMGNKMGLIRVREDIDLSQFPVVEAMLNAVRAIAETNSKKSQPTK